MLLIKVKVMVKRHRYSNHIAFNEVIFETNETESSLHQRSDQVMSPLSRHLEMEEEKDVIEEKRTESGSASASS